MRDPRSKFCNEITASRQRFYVHEYACFWEQVFKIVEQSTGRRQIV